MLGLHPEIILFGLGVGVLIGLTGIGGGSLMTPLLIIVLGVQPVVAVGTDLAYGALTKTLGGYRHLRKGTVDRGVSKWLAFGGVPGTLLGVLIVDRLHHTHGKDFDKVLIGCVAAALLVVASVLLVRTLLLGHLAKHERETFRFTTRTGVAAIALGFVLGLILGLTSVGSGALIGVAMILIFRLTPQRVVGSSVFVAALLLWVGGLAHAISGNVDYALMANILIGSIPGVWIGAHFVERVPDQALRVTLAAVLLGSALAMVNTAGGHIPVWAIFGAPVLVGILGFLLRGRALPAASAVKPAAPAGAVRSLGSAVSSSPAGSSMSPSTAGALGATTTATLAAPRATLSVPEGS